MSVTWDFVTLQQVSLKSYLRETFEPYLGELVSLVGELAPQARIMLHQTWAYRSDSPFYPENGITQKIMHARIAENYRHFADKHGCGVIPSGEAVDIARRWARKAFTWPDEDFDYQHSQPPALPRQDNSLEVGWYWAITNSPDGQGELRLDARHLNDRGCYITGATWFERLTGMDVRETSFVPQGIEDDDAAFLREIAHEAVARHE